MDSTEGTISYSTYKAIEIVVSFGLVFLFCWSQLRAVRRADEKARAEEEARRVAGAAAPLSAPGLGQAGHPERQERLHEPA